MLQITRWYKGFSYTGQSKQLVEEISRQVQKHHLSEIVPLMRVQRGIKNKKFYFFIAINSSKIGLVPPELESVLLKLSFFKYPIRNNPSFTYEDIKPMVGAAHDVYDYTKQIPYKLLEKSICDNPFDFIKLSSINESLSDINAIEANSHLYERLLYWLSAVGSGTWESFKKACNTLKLEEPKRILRRLRLLGHIEFSSDGSRWSIAPTTIVKNASRPNSQEFLLCGSRSINLIQKLKQQTTLEFINQPRGEAPPCVRIKANNPDIISNVVEKLSSEFFITITDEVSKQLVNILPELTTWEQNLRNLQGIVPSLYEWERFDGHEFVTYPLPRETGMYRMYNQKISDRPLYTLFYNQESNSWLQGDWYGLRFLALQYSGQQCIARYEVETKRFAIPTYQRLPELYERALVLASGILPKYSNSWLLYENIEQDVMHKLCDRLNIDCEW